MTLPATNTAPSTTGQPTNWGTPANPYGYQQWHPASLVQAAPHRCPVCDGLGSVVLDFYKDEPTLLTQNKERQSCRACWGAGYLWYHGPTVITVSGAGT